MLRCYSNELLLTRELFLSTFAGHRHSHLRTYIHTQKAQRVKKTVSYVFFTLSPSFALPKLSRAVVRVRRLAAHLSKATMSTNHQGSSPSSAANGDTPTAAILIIGDEILKVI